MTASAVSDQERLADTRHVLHGPSGNPARKEVAYAAYVAVILVGLYGFPVLRALVLAADPEAMGSALRSPWAVLVVVAVTAVVAVLGREAGRVRGPVVAPVPWVDHVVASSLDRWAALRPWFGYSLFAVLFAGGLSGLLVGAAFLGARAASWWFVPITVAVGLLVGLVGGTTWLLGQSRLSPPLRRGPRPGVSSRLGAPSAEVRRMGLPELRTQAARSNRIVGGVQAGDLRAVRLEAARPVTRGRALRLRRRGPVATLVARDVLGLRRAPGAAVVGLVLTVLGGVTLGATLGSSAVPPLVGFVAAIIGYVGFGALAEGLRLEADTVGTPALFGMPPVRAAATHLVVPGLTHLVGTTLAGSVTALAVGSTVGEVLPWCVMTTVVLSGGSLLAAYRGRPPATFSTVPSPQTVAIWYSSPLVLCTLLVGGMVWGAVQWPTSGLLVIATWVAGASIVYAGLRRVDRESMSHRDV
ncbi:hypothetical protein [Knoellia aerolata]|uniref:Uncharacterized protein n=1 Tax=Knoellia aerolata DSM 18566 TaxID=1385519 RepID=A0A0A0JMM8_9MICO|nr:hypothetical protein [Knoellia aerolata]KGN37322.1 hypothetical protein N801_10500 [Knoellia aerolata DSM 18566]